MSDVAAPLRNPPARGLPDEADPERTAEERRAEERPGLYAPQRAGRSARMIGEVVVDLGLADAATVERAVSVAREQGRPTGQVLVGQGVLRQDQLARVVAERFGLDYVDLSVFEVDVGATSLLDPAAAKRYQAVPIGFTDDGTLLLAMADPTNVLTVDDIAMRTGRRVRPVAASLEDLEMVLTRLGAASESIEDIVRAEDEDHEADAVVESAVEEDERDAPIIRLVQSIIAQGVAQGASDVHINPEETDARVLYRIDGVLTPAATVKRKMAIGMVSRIKIIADMDISEKRVPQDGRFGLTVDGRRVDIRVVTLPLTFGEGAVLRILDRGVRVQGVESLGMPADALARLSAAINRPSGAVLVTGPTGSGKTTTLYAALSAINDGKRSILTIEDPVEQRLVGIKQMQIAPKAGVTFDTGLRSMLRADPDVIMVGEIRDAETAHIAVEAALTGHLVLSTLHTRDAPSGIGRLIDMGIEPFLISAAIDTVIAQRLVRVLCQHCKRPQKVSESVLESHGLAGATPHEAVGCSRCGNSGYRGRMGVYEVMTVSEQIRALILERASVDAMVAVAEREGMRRLRADALDKVRQGVTSIAEVERMTTSLI
jgi:type IV pilus assembly protein PilB